MACGERATLLDLVGELEAVMGRKAEPEFAPPRPGDVKHSLASIDKARERFGYAPVVRFDEGIRYTVAFFGTNGGE